jgi:hypothetical protein
LPDEKHSRPPLLTWFMLRLCRMLFCQPLLSLLPLSVFSRNHW